MATSPSLSPRSFRLVCAPAQRTAVEDLLRAQGFDFEEEPFHSSARRLLAEPLPLGLSLAAFFGWIYIQDRSSMLPPLALNPPEGAAVLDMCASPGSKTGLLAQLAEKNGFVLGNEPSRARLATLSRNLLHMNLLQSATCSFAGERLPLPDAGWEHILLDPPCSGWGTEDKHPRVRTLWRDDKTLPLIRLQRLLLKEAARLLAPGGRLVYSTCTTNTEENEAQMRFAVNELGLRPLPLTPFPGFCFDGPAKGAEGSLLVNGRESGAQGFFIALLEKPGTAPTFPPGSVPAKRPPRFLPPEILDAATRALLPPGEIALFGENAVFMPAAGLARLPADLFRGCTLGAYHNGRLRLSPRLRCLLPPVPGGNALEVEDLALIHDLVAGRGLKTALQGKEAVLYRRGLPLAGLRIKNGRALLGGQRRAG